MDGKVKLYYKVWTNMYNVEFSPQLQSFTKIMQIDPKLYIGSHKKGAFSPTIFGMRFSLPIFCIATLQKERYKVNTMVIKRIKVNKRYKV
jgi:hypothetical protein